MKPQNLIFIMSDEHSNQTMGCTGHPMVRTPNLDALAARGTRFTAHYTTSPICVPARASLATGLYPHQTRNWCNGTPYYGEIRGWNHRLRDLGYRVTSIGKLHFRSEDDDTGFDEQIIPMHVVDGVGDVAGAVRDRLPLPVRHQTKKLSEGVGPGDSSYLKYDRDILREAQMWLTEEAPKYSAKPWVLFVSFVCPHFPLVAPPEFYDMYDPADIPVPKGQPGSGYIRHPWAEALAQCQIYDRFFTPETRAIARAAYYGMVSFLDDNIGKLLGTLVQSGHAGDTRVLYTSDHGDNLGARGMWGKSNFYEESAGIPLIIAGEGVPAGRVCDTATNLLDCYQTILDGAGIALTAAERSLPGQSLYGIANADDDPARAVGAEYHAVGAASGAFMIRQGRFKYVYYVGYPPELFDLEADPEEMDNLAGKPEQSDRLVGLEQTLRTVFDPEAIDRQAHADQAALVNRHGGRDAVLKRGGFLGTPIPGDTAEFVPSN